MVFCQRVKRVTGDYKSLIAITEKLTGLNIDTIKVTDYNAAVEAMRAGELISLVWW